MTRTKIICTLGPSCATKKELKNMIQAGMSVARFNFSHGTHETHKQMLKELISAREELGVPVSVMMDTKGPEIRIKDFVDGKVTLKKGDTFCFYTTDYVGDNAGVSVTYKMLPQKVKKSTQILANDGQMQFSVTSVEPNKITTKVVVGGVLSNKKSLNLPNTDLEMPYISEQDKLDIEFACKNKADFLALSFVTKKTDVLEVKKLTNEFGHPNIKLISKIESPLGIDNLDEIIEVSDGIMVARGDLGVEVDFEKVPLYQKFIIGECIAHGKLVITATQMLESMTTSSRPTRAEVSDVHNAILDGTNLIMLSGETSAGEHPSLVVKTMNKIALQAERVLPADYYADVNVFLNNYLSKLAYSVCATVYSFNAKQLVITDDDVAIACSLLKPAAPIYALTKNPNMLAAYSGVIPVKATNGKKFIEERGLSHPTILVDKLSITIV